MVKTTFTAPYRYKTITEGKILDPLILLPMKTQIGWYDTLFLLDSGADTTMLSLRLAEKLGLYYNRLLKIRFFGIEGRGINAYRGRILVKIGGVELGIRCYFAESDDPTLLLGRLDLFDKFNITFDSSQKQIIFREIIIK